MGNRNVHRQRVGFMLALSQYVRDLWTGEVVGGRLSIGQRPLGSICMAQRFGLDLRYPLGRSSYCNIFSLTMEAGHYLKSLLRPLDAPDIKKAFDANTR